MIQETRKGSRPRNSLWFVEAIMNLIKGNSVHKTAIGVIALFFFLSGQASSQTSQTLYDAASQSNSIQDLGYSARSVILGPAFVGVADDTSALFNNPAGLASLIRAQVAFDSYFGLVDAAQETGVLAIPAGSFGGIGLAGSYLDYGTFEGRDTSGSLTPSYSAGRFGFQAGWGITLLKGFAAGTALHYSQQEIVGSSYSFLTADVGVLLNPWKGWKIGLDYLAPGWGSFGSPLVSVLKTGASWDFSLDSSTKILTALGNALQSNSLDYLQAGIEASYRHMYFLRAGYQIPFNDNGYEGFSNISIGAGIILSDFGLDYAYTPSGNLSDSNRFSLSYFLGQRPKNSRSVLAPSNAQSLSNSQSKRTPGTSASLTGMSVPLSPTQAGGNGSSLPTSTVITVPSTPSTVAAPQTEKDREAGNSLALHFDIPADFTSQGDQMATQGHLVEALVLYQKAVQQDPQNLQAWWKMGKIYYQANRKTDAIQCFQKVLDLRPDDQALKVWLNKYRASP